MRYMALAFAIFLTACGQQPDKTAALQQQIDSLQQQLHDVYKPGLGEFMSGIQVHHAKLWFAGQAQNWKLAGFEIGEINESVDDIKKYCTDRPGVAQLPMLAPALDSVTNAIAHSDAAGFKSGFVLLTATCNNCHQATKHEFNVIRIPATPPFTNQVFDRPK
jgi:hypothetical protein